jgi:hypothetical protein
LEAHVIDNVVNRIPIALASNRQETECREVRRAWSLVRGDLFDEDSSYRDWVINAFNKDPRYGFLAARSPNLSFVSSACGARQRDNAETSNK